LAAFALVLLLGQHVLPALHHAVETHEICPEHGELVHELAAKPSEQPASQGAGISGGEPQHEHGHCAVVPAVQRKEYAPATSSALLITPAPVAAITIALRDHTRVSKTRLFRLAPKQSPPA
jgi:hypothetical protein